MDTAVIPALLAAWLHAKLGEPERCLPYAWEVSSWSCLPGGIAGATFLKLSQA